MLSSCVYIAADNDKVCPSTAQPATCPSAVRVPRDTYATALRAATMTFSSEGRSVVRDEGPAVIVTMGALSILWK